MSKHVLSSDTKRDKSMNEIIIVVLAVLSYLIAVDSYEPCPVEWHKDLRNHEERMDKCVLRSRNKHIGWELKETK